MKINIGKNDICYTCQFGKQTECDAGIDDVFLDDTGNICDCKCYKAKEKKERSKRFVKPTIEEITAYAREKGYNIDANSFYNYYESVDWHIGKKKMSKWKSAVANWDIRQKKWEAEKQKKDNKGKLQSKPSYDLEELKRKIMNNTEI